MEDLVGKRVLVTGHTGFKGAWLALWLHRLGAKVHGFALAEDPAPAAYTALGIRPLLASEKIADVGDFEAVETYHRQVDPEVVFHLAAQPLVRASYGDPLGTLHANVLGTAHVLESLRRMRSRCACVVVTSDKCYESDETGQPHREDDRMGGHDIYSMSKGACELLVSAYRRSFFQASGERGGTLVASARAGNVVGGGDYAADRIVPDCVRSLRVGETIGVRNPDSTRPWQHVLEPLAGYLLLARKLLGPDGREYCTAWNFGPEPDQTLPVRRLVERFLGAWGSGAWEPMRTESAPREATLLSLNIEKSRKKLQWIPRWDIEKTIRHTADWYRRFEDSARTEGAMRAFSLEQISEYEWEARR